MEYRVDCVCGEHIMVREGAAGAKFTCKCGKPIQVPSLSELHKSAGIKIEISPEFVIENLLIAGELPTGHSCSYCGGETSDVLMIYVECQHQSAPMKWLDFARAMATLLFEIVFKFIIFSIARVFIISRQDAEIPEGTADIFTLPILICPSCRPALYEPANIKRCLCKEPEYQRLLEKYPNARIELAL